VHTLFIYKRQSLLKVKDAMDKSVM